MTSDTNKHTTPEAALLAAGEYLDAQGKERGE